MLIKSFGNFFKKDSESVTFPAKTHYTIRGSGLSYNDSAIFEKVKFSKNEKFLMNLKENEVLVSAGKTLEEINRILNMYGYELPVTPGTMLITAGGAFAANIHGKSHHIYGAFADQVKNIKYIKNDGSVHVTKNGEEIFNSLAGSFGMLYEILELVLKVNKTKSNALDITHTKAEKIEDLISLMNNDRSTHTVAWFDSSFYTGSNGRGVYMSANEADKDCLVKKIKKHKITHFPSFLMKSSKLVSLLNSVYYFSQKTKKFKQNKTSYLYPLDSMINWDNAYGNIGMFQFQCVISENNIFKFIDQMKQIMIRYKMVSFVSVLKKFGEATKRSPLDFPISNGYTIAMDFSASDSNISGAKELNELVCLFEGKNYLVKDSFLDASLFHKQYGDKGVDFLKHCIEENQFSGLCSDMMLRLCEK